MNCPACGALNREKARFCKYCAAALSNQPLQGLTGLQEIRDELQALRDMTEGRRLAGRDPRVPYTTLILGKSGTAKSRLGGLIAAELAQLKWTTRPNAVVIDAQLPDALTSKNIETQFAAAKGGVLFIDNAQMLVNDMGEPAPLMSQLMRLIEAQPLDPVVVMAGLPFGLREFLDERKYNNLSSRFRNVFKIDDYPPAQLLEITLNQLLADGFTLGDDARTRLALRLRWLHRQTRKPDNDVPDLNGRMAVKEAMEIADQYYRRRGQDRVILPEDIQGEVEVRKSIDEVLKELNGFIGMDSIKHEVRELYELINNARKLEQSGHHAGGGAAAVAQHCTITGSPGTGKTTVARVLGEIFEALGVLSGGHVVEVDRSKLVGQYQGQTAPLVNNACDKAMGGVLFIDEAYALKQGDQDNFGKEAIDTLLKRMEDDRGKFMVVAAGYPKEIDDFLRTNPGLSSRFQKRFELADYKPAELAAIFESVAHKAGYTLGDAAREKVLDYFADRCARKTRDFGNGREARNLWDVVIRAQSKRVSSAAASAEKAFFTTVEADDIPAVSTGGGNQLAAAMDELNGLIGLDGVKTAVGRLRAKLEMQRLLGSQEVLNRHYIFTGNPGTGKTTVARILAKVFHGLGMLPTDALVEVDRGKLVGQYLGQTAPLVNNACDKAMGGVLFIDEAYALASDQFGLEAINTLLKRMEDDRGKFVVIVAGYAREMGEFLATNSGLPSRFSDSIDFEDYGAPEMMRIFKSLAAKSGMGLGEGFEAALQTRIDHILAHRDRQFANARTVRQLFDKLCEACADRAMQAPDDDARRAAGRMLLVVDLDPTPATKGVP